MQKTLILMVSSLYLIAGCQPHQKISERQEKFTIVGINPPKHFYVDLKDEKGNVSKNLYVSKHCFNWRNVKIGSEVTLPVIKYKNNDGFYEKIKTNSICPKS